MGYRSLFENIVDRCAHFCHVRLNYNQFCSHCCLVCTVQVRYLNQSNTLPANVEDEAGLTKTSQSCYSYLVSIKITNVSAVVMFVSENILLDSMYFNCLSYVACL